MVGYSKETELGEKSLWVVEEELLKLVGHMDPARNRPALEDLSLDFVDQGHPGAAHVAAGPWNRGAASKLNGMPRIEGLKCAPQELPK